MEAVVALILGGWVALAGVFITVKLKKELKELESEELDKR